MSSGRQLFDAMRGRGSASRPPIVAPVDALAARIAGVPFGEMTRDAALWASGITRATELLGLDAVVVGFDFELTRTVLEQDGWDNPSASGRLAVVIDTADRLFQVVRAEKACIAVMTGPVTLAAQLFGEAEALTRVAEVKQVQTAIAKALCETRPDMLLFLERAPFANTPVDNAERRAYNALKNTTKYYDVASALWLEGYDASCLPSLERLAMEFVVPVPSASPDTVPHTVGPGIAVPLDDADAAVAIAGRAGAMAARAFLINDAPLAGDVQIETVVDCIEALRRVSCDSTAAASA